ncbi:MAG TPA: signal peptidase I [bacterium]|nr:signal peptidase I [bacterium]
MIFTDDFKARLRLLSLSLLDAIKIGLVALAIVLPIRLFLVCPFYVKGASMEPTFHDREYLLIDEISYRFNQPKRGEVIVFRYPQDPKEFFIKRIIGLPGETLKFVNGQVYLLKDKSMNTWTKVDESYLPAENQTFALEDGEVTLGSEEYYVLGDNREHSRDSRYFGSLHRRYFIGRVMFRGLPIKRAQFFEAPTYTLTETGNTETESSNQQ